MLNASNIVFYIYYCLLRVVGKIKYKYLLIHVYYYTDKTCAYITRIIMLIIHAVAKLSHWYTCINTFKELGRSDWSHTCNSVKAMYGNACQINVIWGTQLNDHLKESRGLCGGCGKTFQPYWLSNSTVSLAVCKVALSCSRMIFLHKHLDFFRKIFICLPI